MRIVSNTITNAIEQPADYKVSSRLTAYKSRVYFRDADLSSGIILEARTRGDGLQPLGEALTYSESGEVITAYVDTDEFVILSLSKQGVLVTPEIDTNWLYTNLGNRPGLWKDPSSDDCVLGYYDQDYRRWMMRDLNISALLAGNAECVSAEKFSINLGQGAIYPVSLTEAVILDIYEGGMRFSFVDSAGSAHTCSRRYMNPTAVFDSSSDDIYITHFAGAVKRNNVVYIYFTHYTGAVKCIRYKLSGDGLSGIWSDFSTSIPQDLCVTGIGNVFLRDSRIFISATFQRNEDFVSDVIYNFLVWSDDGITFTMNRRVLCSLSGLRFLAAVRGDMIAFSSSSRFYETTAPYQVIGEETESSVLTIDGLSGSPANEVTINILAGDERYFENPLLETGTYMKLETSQQTSIGMEYVRYLDGVLTSITKTIRDGFRGHILNLVPDAAWHTSSMSHPFYMEFQGKQCVFDPCTDLSNLVKESVGENAFWPLTVDFWEGDGTSPGYETHPGGTSTDHWSADLLQSHSAYPKFGVDDYYTARIYGWSRAGRPDTDPNTADDTPQGTLNDKFYLLLEVKNPSFTNSETKVYQLDPLEYLMSAYANPPQTYFATNPGSLPVIWAIPNPGVGWEILKVGVRVISDTGNTTYNLERVELPSISSQPISVADTGGAFSIAPIPMLSDSLIEQSWIQMSVPALTPAFFAGAPPISYSASAGIAWAPEIPICVMVGKDLVFTSADGKEWASRSCPAGYWYDVCWSPELHLFAAVGSSGVMTSPDGINWTLRSCPATIWFRIAWAPEIMKFCALSQEQYSNYSNSMTSSDGITWAGSPPNQTIWDPSICWANSLGLFVATCGLLEVSGYVHTYFKNGSATSPDGVTWTSHDESPMESLFFLCWSEELGVIVASGRRLAISTDGRTFTNVSAPSHGHPTYGERWHKPYWSSSLKLFIVKAFYSSAYITSPDGINWTTAGYAPGGVMHSLDTYSITGEAVDTTLISPLFYAMSYDGFKYVVVPEYDFSDNARIASSITCEKKNIPQVLLSTRPYSSYNFEQTCRGTVEGPYSIIGLVGLATDKQNFILASVGKDKARISKYRAGIETVLVEVAAPGLVDQKIDLRFWHRDGKFGLEYKLYDEVVWPDRGSMVYYEWQYEDGEMALNDDIFHVGAFSFIDPPRFRITGFRSDQSILGVLPLDIDLSTNTSDFLTEFPMSGKIDLGGIKYTYSGKSIYFPNNDMRGPFQLCNTREWNSPYNSEFDGSFSYQGGPAIEFLMFDYSVGGGLAAWASGAVIASSSGYAWLNDQTQWVPWIRTSGQKVLLRARVRMYADDMPDWSPSTSEKIYVTNGLTGVSRVSNDNEIYQYNHGEYAFLDSDDKVTIFGYSAASGDADQTIESLLALLAAVAGTEARFPGNQVYDVPGSSMTNNQRVEFNG